MCISHQILNRSLTSKIKKTYYKTSMACFYERMDRNIQQRYFEKSLFLLPQVTDSLVFNSIQTTIVFQRWEVCHNIVALIVVFFNCQ